jgi:hypothetical protein
MNRSVFYGGFLGGLCFVLASLASRQVAQPAEALQVAGPVAQTSSIGVLVTAWRRTDVQRMKLFGIEYRAPEYVFVEAHFVAGECAVKAQIADLVSNPMVQCFDAEEFAIGHGRVLVPVPAEPERVIRLSAGSRWWRVNELREGGSSRRRPSRS